jgi:hypothetical protein
MACFNKATCFMPYYDSATESIVQFNPNDGLGVGWLQNYGATALGFGNLQVDFGWLNKANPDWLHLYDLLSAQAVGPLTALTYTKTTANISYVSIVANTPLPKACDFWYNSLNFAKVGIFAWANGAGPASFIGFIPNYMLFGIRQAVEIITQEFEGFFCGPATDGVVLNCICYSRLLLPPFNLNGTDQGIPL